MYYRHSNHPGKTFSIGYEDLKAAGVAVESDTFFDKKIKVGEQELTLAGIKFDAKLLANAITAALA
jgi:hypothetical protein